MARGGAKESEPGSNVVFFDEEELRDRIAEEPSRVTGKDARAAAAREVSVPPMVGFADVVIVEADGAITIVECKLYDNPESHGAVIGQALSYAAGLCGLDYESFKDRFENGKLGRGSASLTEPFQGLEGWSESAFSKDVACNLAAGRFRVVIAADEMSEPLKLTLEFLRKRQPAGIVLSAHEVSTRPSGEKRPKPSREILIAGIRETSGESAAATAEALIDWANGERLSVSFVRREAIVSTSRGTLFRIKRYSQVRVSLDSIKLQLEYRGNEGQLEGIEQELDALGVKGDRRKARGLLAALDAEAFIVVMRRVLEAIPR